MTTMNKPLVPLGKDYVFTVSVDGKGPHHGVWGRSGRRTCCGIGIDFPEEGLVVLEAAINCERCLASLRAQGWDVYWCAAHEATSGKVAVTCPSCKRPTHVHQADVANAKRGWVLRETCPGCRRSFDVQLTKELKLTTVAITR